MNHNSSKVETKFIILIVACHLKIKLIVDVILSRSVTFTKPNRVMLQSLPIQLTENWYDGLYTVTESFLAPSCCQIRLLILEPS